MALAHYKLSAFPEYTEKADGKKIDPQIYADHPGSEFKKSVKIRGRSHSLQDSLKLVTEDCGQNTDSGYGKRRATEAFAKDRPNFFLPSDRMGPQECCPAGRLQKLRPSLGIGGICGTNIVGGQREICGKLQGLLRSEIKHWRVLGAGSVSIPQASQLSNTAILVKLVGNNVPVPTYRTKSDPKPACASRIEP